MARESQMAAVQPVDLETGSEFPSLAPLPVGNITREIPVGDVPAAPMVAQAEALIQMARGADPLAQRALAERINDCFQQMAQRGGSRAAADFILRALEGGALADLQDKRGRTCRAAATQALLGLGYPFALEVSPEDLDHLRVEEGWRSQANPLAAIAVLLAAGASVLSAALGLDPGLAAWPLVAGSLVGGLLAAYSWAGTRRLAVASGLLGMVAVGGAALVVLGHPFTLIPAVGSIAALTLALRRPKR